MMKIKNFLCLLFLVAITNVSFAQLTDLARLEYSFIPKTKSEDQYMRLRALVNYPIELKEDTYFIIGAEYNRVILNLEDDYPFDASLLETINIIDLNLGYTFKTSEMWRLGFKINPRIASTLTQSITADDLFLNGGVFVINDRSEDESAKRPYRLILGLTYNTTTGLPFPLPFVSYSRTINENWSFAIGIPKSNVKYFFDEKHTIQAFASVDGYFAHVQEPTMTDDGKSVDHISLSVVVGGFGYEYKLSKYLYAYSYLGYTARLDNVLRDNDRNDVFSLDNLNAFYLRTGLKLKI
ncbi:DUF6268 family outer membrane beta-barrel protein [Winogradskyella ursingii]|uniref:DUF6268 family outer membrane beta-barrel protein n=1 Tax=Winogradskyella ursingii TaxID=2686079 RepID=UPI001FE74D46|nr:DUF6268 family outer membrane beta-barrel protein [Winogradskyella ursingii]